MILSFSIKLREWKKTVLAQNGPETLLVLNVNESKHTGPFCNQEVFLDTIKSY